MPKPKEKIPKKTKGPSSKIAKLKAFFIRNKKKVIIAAAALIVLTAGIVTIVLLNSQSKQADAGTYLVFSINPKLMLHLNDDGTVEHAYQLNDDAAIFKNDDFRTLNLESAIDKTIDISTENDYLKTNKKVSVSILENGNREYLDQAIARFKDRRITAQETELSKNQQNEILNQIKDYTEREMLTVSIYVMSYCGNLSTVRLDETVNIVSGNKLERIDYNDYENFDNFDKNFYLYDGSANYREKYGFTDMDQQTLEYLDANPQVMREGLKYNFSEPVTANLKLATNLYGCGADASDTDTSDNSDTSSNHTDNNQSTNNDSSASTQPQYNLNDGLYLGVRKFGGLDSYGHGYFPNECSGNNGIVYPDGSDCGSDFYPLVDGGIVVLNDLCVVDKSVSDFKASQLAKATAAGYKWIGGYGAGGDCTEPDRIANEKITETTCATYGLSCGRW